MFFHRFTTKVADQGKTENVEEEYMAETEEPTKENHASATYQQGIDEFYQSQAESQKKTMSVSVSCAKV